MYLHECVFVCVFFMFLMWIENIYKVGEERYVPSTTPPAAIEIALLFGKLVMKSVLWVILGAVASFPIKANVQKLQVIAVSIIGAPL